MGHFVFIVIHIICIAFGLWGLIISIPLHILYGAVKGGKPTIIHIHHDGKKEED